MENIMDAHAVKPIIRKVHVRQGEAIKPPHDKPTLQEHSAIGTSHHDHSYFFSLRRGLSIRFSRT